MTNFDIGIGITDSLANQFLNSIYSTFGDSVFSGKETVTDPLGSKVTISWNIQEAPTLNFSPLKKDDAVNEVKENMLNHKDFTSQTTENQESLIKSAADAIVTSCFQLQLSKVHIQSISEEGKITWDKNCRIDVLIQLETENGILKIKPLKAKVFDEQGKKMWFINHIVLPAILSVVQNIIPPINLPSIELPNISLTPPLSFISKGKASAICNRSSLGVPPAPVDQLWPESPFFLTLKPEFIADSINKNLANFSKEFGVPNDKLFIGIGTLKYAANATVHNIVVTPTSSPVELNFSADLSGHVQGGFESIIPFTPTIGVNYKIVSNGKINGKIGISIEGGTLKVKTIQLTPITISIIPTGGLVEWILSAVTAPLLNVLGLTIVPLISTFFNDLSFDVLTISQLSIPIMGQVIKVTPENLMLSPFDDIAAVTGNIITTAHKNVKEPSIAMA